MINGLLGYWTPGPIELIVTLIVILIVFGLPIFLIVLFVRCIVKGSKERQKLRLELGKVADELQQLRRQREDEKGESLAESRQ